MWILYVQEILTILYINLLYKMSLEFLDIYKDGERKEDFKKNKGQG